MGYKYITKEVNHQDPPGGPQIRKTITPKSGVIYIYKCARVWCDEEVIGESARPFGEKVEEDLKVHFPLYDQCNITGHPRRFLQPASVQLY